MEEVWKDIPGYEGYYKVSNKNRVFDIKRNKIKLPFIDSRNRMTISLRKDGVGVGFSFPRLVAMAFVKNPNPKEYIEVNHKDENPLNNDPSNLEWCTKKYNCNYGTRIQRIREKQSMPVLQYTLNGEFIAEYASMHIAANIINADAGHICDCCLGKRKYAYGYFWRYKDDELYEQAKIRLAEKIEKSKKSRADKFTEKAYNVVQLTLDGQYVATHLSSKYAAESVGSFRPMIINCCNGKIPHVKGYKWRYEKDYKQYRPGEQLTFDFF